MAAGYCEIGEAESVMARKTTAGIHRERAERTNKKTTRKYI